ncbi:hypothetical protein H2203_008303 [Taxawa tesnikishii (nom. ined.)]|nr:hypothetical protein H2203_008303 [Dothideales sp. JES 119]
MALKEKRDTLALTRVLTSHEAALSMDSPKGLMLHGEVGTGKSMLIDLFADCLPNRKKRRWHFNTFMLETIAKLEQLRRDRLSRIPPTVSGIEQDDHSLLWLARDMIQTSPILFLDEFQLPDRAASKIMTNLMTSFFQLGGVLIATSNRMPEELDKAAGTTFAPPPSRLDSLRWRFGAGARSSGRSESMFAGQGEFAGFLEVLRARCEVWEMEGRKDYRRQENDTRPPIEVLEEWQLDGHDDFHKIPKSAANQLMMDPELASPEEGETAPASRADSVVEQPPSPKAPRNYFIIPPPGSPESDLTAFHADLAAVEKRAVSLPSDSPNSIPWQSSSMVVYGRTISVPRAHAGVTSWTFAELCGSTLGPADYITLASTYHTLVLTDIPVLVWLQKNEARRFITLLDALYEARCKLLISAAAGPDELFFPEQTREGEEGDAVHSETFSEAYQDVTAPFRPNVLSQNPEYTEESYPEHIPSPEPDYTHARLQGVLAPDSLEDDPPNRIRRERGPVDPDDDLLRRRPGPDFGRTGAFTGEDERFAYKRARSRLWEMCGTKWWARGEEGWHKPVPAEVRRWERSVAAAAAAAAPVAAHSPAGVDGEDAKMGASRELDEKRDEVMFRHGASPFRTSREPPPKFSWTHIWGTMKWGKKAGAWGQGVEGLKDRGNEKR